MSVPEMNSTCTVYVATCRCSFLKMETVVSIETSATFSQHSAILTETCNGTLRYITVHYSALRYITVHYGALRYITVHYGTLRCITVHDGTLRYITVHYGTLRYMTVHYGT